MISKRRSICRWLCSYLKGEKSMQVSWIFIWLETSIKKWHDEFDNVMISSGFIINHVDKCIYLKIMLQSFACMLMNCSFFGLVLMLWIYTKMFLASKLDMKDMYDGITILGIRLPRIMDSYNHIVLEACWNSRDYMRWLHWYHTRRDNTLKACGLYTIIHFCFLLLPTILWDN